MFRSLLIAGALLSTGPEGTAAQPGERPVTADGCDSLPQCLARVRAADSGVLRGGNHLYRDIVRFGAPAVDALVPMLRDPDLNVRERAGYLLAQFPSIDRRHFPALVEAWRHGDTINHQGRGNGWLPRAIAATGTDEALRLLWADYERDPEQGRNSQTFFALAWGFPEQVRPLLLARIAACRDSDGAGISDGNYRGPCAGIYSLLQEYRPRFPAWSIPAILDLAAHGRSDTVRAGAEDTLARFSNPAALAPLQRRLASFPRGPEARQRGWEVSRLIMQIVRYGAAARASGPAIIPYLTRPMTRICGRTRRSRSVRSERSPRSLPCLRLPLTSRTTGGSPTTSPKVSAGSARARRDLCWNAWRALTGTAASATTQHAR
jgi:hypothetical protein